MEQKFELYTEGVFVLAVEKGIKNYYTDKDFDYSYPEGILPLIDEGIALALTTESGDDLQVTITTNKDFDTSSYSKVGQHKLFLDTEDTLNLWNHAEFTQICDSCNGDTSQYNFYEERKVIKGLGKGGYLLELFSKENIIIDEDEEEIEIIELVICLDYKGNEGIDLPPFETVYRL